MRKNCLFLLGVLLLLCACRQKPNAGDAIVSITPTPAHEAVLTPAPTSKPTSAPEPTTFPALPNLPNPVGLLGQTYKERFTKEVVCSDTSYTSPTISLSWEQVTDSDTFGKPVTYFVVDIYVQDVKAIKTAFSNNRLTAGGYKTLQKMSQNVNAVAAISGDYASWRPKGLVIRNGEVLRTSLDNARDVGVLYADGTFVCYEAGEVPLEEILSNNPWQSWCFGPSLLTAEGKTKAKFNSRVARSNPRAVFGYYAPGHYCFVQVDGRAGSYSKGLTLAELSQLMYTLGCTAAINLDGGATARLAWNHQLISRPSGDRSLHDIIYVEAYE